jgi:hypothetical protein
MKQMIMQDLRELDVNTVFEHLDEIDAPIDLINDYLILDGAQGHMFAFEGLLEHAGFTDITDDEYEAAHAGAQGALQSLNEVFKTLGVKLEIVKVDMCDFTCWMLVKDGDEPKQVAQQIKKGLTFG